MTDALPCPFCGSTTLAVSVGSSHLMRVIACGDCSAHGPEVRIDEAREPRDAALERWNARTGADGREAGG
jgi:Lar family restriction alleviation protein